MMTETELPLAVQYGLIALQLLGLGIFLYVIWPYVRSESWRKKFIENKTARSLIIVFIVIFVFVYGMGAFFDAFFPIERLDLAPSNTPIQPQ